MDQQVPTQVIFRSYGINPHSSRDEGLPYRWIQETKGAYLSDRCTPVSGNSFIWCNWIFPPMGPDWILGFKIVTAVPESIDELVPGLGSVLVLVLRGGYSISQATLTRFYSAHTFILPLFTLVLLIIHFAMLRKQGISGPL